MAKTFETTGMDHSVPYFGVIMDKKDTAVYPKYDLPPGYSLSHYKPGFEQMWIKQKAAVGEFEKEEAAQAVFRREYLYGSDREGQAPGKITPEEVQSAPLYKQLCEKVLFILDADGGLAATGAIWDGNHFGKIYQRLHWVSVPPAHQNKGLGKVIVSKLLDLYNALGYSGYIYLTSQTWSYKALNIYSRFGFCPYIGEKPQNWDDDGFEKNNAKAWEIISDKINSYGRQ
ncbi:MAG: GNAT family N-acetyltransferase [Oscillospiraceae bacterium]|nr:GNAT family N-acetyltransferase [Oscillospiraceae bacterium]